MFDLIGFLYPFMYVFGVSSVAYFVVNDLAAVGYPQLSKIPQYWVPALWIVLGISLIAGREATFVIHMFSGSALVVVHGWKLFRDVKQRQDERRRRK